MAIGSPVYRCSVCHTHNWNPSHRHTTPSIPVRPISSGPRSDRSPSSVAVEEIGESAEEDSFAYRGYPHSSDSTAGLEEGPLRSDASTCTDRKICLRLRSDARTPAVCKWRLSGGIDNNIIGSKVNQLLPSWSDEKGRVG